MSFVLPESHPLSVYIAAPAETGEGSSVGLPGSDEEDTWIAKETMIQDLECMVKIQPSQQVALSDDLLPLIFVNLKELLELEKGASNWRSGFSSLLLVNRTFFHASADILWEVLDNLTIVFELLPWYKTPYTGIGTHEYAGAADWKRFNLYAPRIQQFELRQAGIISSTACFMELFTLPERPDPLFPALKSVYLLPGALLGMPSLFLLVGPALNALQVTSSPPSERYRAPLLIPPPENIVNVLTTISFQARQLHTFAYAGVTNDEFFHRLSKLTALRTLHLTLIGPVNLEMLEKLCPLKHLQHFAVTVPFLVGRLDKNVVAKPLLVTNRLNVLKTLQVVASEYDQCILARGIPPRTVHLQLGFSAVSDRAVPIHLCLALYLQASPAMKTLVAESVANASLEQIPAATATNADGHYRWPSIKEAQNLLISAIKKTDNLRRLHFLDFPLTIAVSFDNLLRQAIPSLHLLTSLSVRVRLNTASSTWTEPPFVGISFLASGIWAHCPSLAELEYHFRADHILEEDLNLPLKDCEDALKASSAFRPRGEYHRLQKLTINTGLTLAQSSKLKLPISRKVQIAQFLDRLFPTLAEVRGSADGLWSEVDLLVKSYQEQRKKFLLEAGVV